MNNKIEGKAARKAVKQDIQKQLTATAVRLEGKAPGEAKAIKKLANTKMTLQTSGKIGPADSKYLAAILDPVNAGYGAKIPDEITVPSFPFQATTRLAVAPVQDAGASNPFGYVLGVIYTFGCPKATGNQSNVWVLTAFNSVANTSVWTLQATTVRSWSANLISQAAACRLVSGVAMLQGQSNYQQAGKLTSAFCTPTMQSSFTTPPSSPGVGVDFTTYVENFAYSNTLTEKVGFARVLYVPQDNNNLIYSVPGAVAVAGYGVAYFAASGMLAPTTAGGTHELIVVENFECQPLNSNQSLIATTPSKTDPFEMAVAANAIAASPHITTAITTKEAATSGAETVSMTSAKGGSAIHQFDPESQENRPSIMEKIMGGVEKASSFVKDVTPYVAPLLALL